MTPALLARPDLARLCKTLAIGAVGGGVFYHFRMPLAWMMGAMVITTVASMSGASLHVPQRLRSVMVTILGVLLGSTFTSEVLQKAAEWPVTIASLALYLAFLTGVLYVYFRRLVGLDPVTAYFSATPGGLNEMVIVGRAMGGDDRAIALVHGARVLLVVLTVPFWFRYAYGASSGGGLIGPSLVELRGFDLGVLAACAVVGPLAGRLLRLPAYRLVGPMIASAAVHVAGLTESKPPFELVAVAQIVVGSAVGARFAGVPLARVLKTMAASAGATALMLTTTVVFAFSLAPLTGIDAAPIVLAFSPGGLAEMSLIALSLGVETAFVASHHVIRIAMIVITAPLAFRLLRARPPPERPD